MLRKWVAVCFATTSDGLYWMRDAIEIAAEWCRAVAITVACRDRWLAVRRRQAQARSRRAAP